jgi:hypothetical protein
MCLRLLLSAHRLRCHTGCSRLGLQCLRRSNGGVRSAGSRSQLMCLLLQFAVRLALGLPQIERLREGRS